MTEKPKQTSGPVSTTPDGGDVFRSIAAGFSIKKPSLWGFASLEAVAEGRSKVRLKNDKLRKFVINHATAPLVVIMKHKDPPRGINPSVQVVIRPLGQFKPLPPTKIMELVLSALKKSFADFSFVEPIHETTVSGHPAAHSVAQYTVRNNEGRELPATARTWLVPRGDFMFLIGMTGPQDGPDESEGDFRAILASIKIGP